MAYMYTISQMLIYNTHRTHHNTKTTTMRNSKEHETHFLLYQGLNMRGDARLKKAKHIEKSHELGGGEGGGGGGQKGIQRHLVATLDNTQ